MAHVATSIARFTLIEGFRARLPLLVIGLLAVVVLTAEFASGLALTDSQSYRTGVYAALSRMLLVFVVMLFVATSVVREFQDRALDLCLSHPVSRASWYCGRLLGFSVLALSFALLASLPLTFMAAPAQAAAWGISLAAELALITCATLAAVVTLRQVTAAVLATSAFYSLGLCISAIVLMSRGPTVDHAAWSSQVIANGLDLLALAVPRLDQFTRTAWLEVDAAAVNLGPILAQSVVYALLLIAIGLFDVYRSND
jgi:ABC-type transport system involved in multi-copper enzyme maturation permease subunit